MNEPHADKWPQYFAPQVAARNRWATHQVHEPEGRRRSLPRRIAPVVALATGLGFGVPTPATSASRPKPRCPHRRRSPARQAGSASTGARARHGRPGRLGDELLRRVRDDVALRRHDAAPGGRLRLGEPVGERMGERAAPATYHFRVVAVNDLGTTYGADRTFRTR